MEEYDVIICGGGIAGLTAGIYAMRRKMKALLITKDIGGQANLAEKIENYPGFISVAGRDLIQKTYEQVKSFGLEVVFEDVQGFREENGKYIVKTNIAERKTKTVIIAMGKIPRKLRVPGEDKFIGKGVSYCATCDMPLFKDKTVAVIGGGNSALEAALLGSKFAKKVYLVHRRGEFRGFEELVEKVKSKKNVEIVLWAIPKEIKGEEKLDSIVLEKTKRDEEGKIVGTGETFELKVDGIFVEIGFEVDPTPIKDFVKLDERNQVIITSNCETFYPNSDKIRPGVFAAGDITNTPFKQLVIAAGEGCKAALQAYNYIHGTSGPVMVH